MELSGEHRIPAPIHAVWAALNDAETLRACIPGCEELEKDGDTNFRASVRIRIGPVKARFNGEVELADLEPPNSYRISGKGSGGVAGFAKGSALVSLRVVDAQTTQLAYSVDAVVGGKLAQLGQRLVRSTSEKLAATFFDSFCAQFVETS